MISCPSVWRAGAEELNNCVSQRVHLLCRIYIHTHLTHLTHRRSSLRLVAYFVPVVVSWGYWEFDSRSSSHSSYLYVSLSCRCTIVVALLICPLLLPCYEYVELLREPEAPPPTSQTTTTSSLSVFLFLALQLPWPQQLDCWRCHENFCESNSGPELSSL